MRSLISILVFMFGASAFAAPSVPTGVTAVPQSGTTVRISWSASTLPPDEIGTITYRVFRGSTEITTSALSSATLTFNDTTATAGATYGYQVEAYNGAIASGKSPTVTVTTPSTPAVPTGLTAVATAGGVVLDWTNVTGATGYTIFRNGTEIDTSTSSTYTDTEIDPSTTYRYSVSATNAAGDSDESGEVTVTTKGDGSQREAVWGREFRRADGNFDKEVTFEEYLVAFPNTLPWTVMRNRFIGTDDNEDDVLTVDEYIAHFAGKTVKRPSKAQTFFLADEDGDDLLDPVEYALTLNRGTKPAQVTKRFDKLDKSDSGMLSQQEFGIRYGTGE